MADQPLACKYVELVGFFHVSRSETLTNTLKRVFCGVDVAPDPKDADIQGSTLQGTGLTFVIEIPSVRKDAPIKQAIILFDSQTL